MVAPHGIKQPFLNEKHATCYSRFNGWKKVSYRIFCLRYNFVYNFFSKHIVVYQTVTCSVLIFLYIIEASYLHDFKRDLSWITLVQWAHWSYFLWLVEKSSYNILEKIQSVFNVWNIAQKDYASFWKKKCSWKKYFSLYWYFFKLLFIVYF